MVAPNPAEDSWTNWWQLCHLAVAIHFCLHTCTLISTHYCPISSSRSWLLNRFAQSSAYLLDQVLMGFGSLILSLPFLLSYSHIFVSSSSWVQLKFSLSWQCFLVLNLFHSDLRRQPKCPWIPQMVKVLWEFSTITFSLPSPVTGFQLQL